MTNDIHPTVFPVSSLGIGDLLTELAMRESGLFVLAGESIESDDARRLAIRFELEKRDAL